MEARLLLAFVLMGLVLFGTQYFYKPPPQPPQQTPATKAVQPAKPAPAAPAPIAAQAAPIPKEMPGEVKADKEETITVESDLYRVVFSNRGAVVRNWILKAYKDHNGKPLDLVNQKALAKVPAPFSLLFKSQTPSTDPNNALFRTERSPDGLSVTFEFSDGRAITKKSFRFEKRNTSRRSPRR